MKTINLLLITITIVMCAVHSVGAPIEGGLVAPGSYEFLSLQPCGPHLTVIGTPMNVASLFDYYVIDRIEYVSFSLFPALTEAGRSARNAAYNNLITTYPDWEPHLVTGQIQGQFYSIDIEYELIASLSYFNNGLFHSEACFASGFSEYNGCHTVVSSIGTVNQFDRTDNAYYFWGGQAGILGPNKRAALHAIGDCPKLMITQGDGRITLAPIVRETSHAPFTAVPPSFTFEVGFNAAMNTGMNPLHYVEFHTDPGTFSIDNAYWWDDYTMHVEVSSSGEACNRRGLFGIDTALAAAGNPKATLDGDMIAPNDDHYYFCMGQDCSTGCLTIARCRSQLMFAWPSATVPTPAGTPRRCRA